MADRLVLYVVPASHPCVAVMKALDLKGLSYERVDMMFGVSNGLQIKRFGGRTVPGLTVGREKVVGSRLIMRALEGIEPEPPLVPRDPELRAQVNEADEWGEQVFQEHARWISLSAVARRPEAFASFTEGYRVPELPGWAVKRAGVGVGLEGRLLGHTGDRIRNEYLPALPADFDKIDGLISDGVIGGEQPNVADLQIGSSVRLFLNLADIAPAIEERPCGQLARRLFPEYPGHVPEGTVDSPLAVPVAQPS